MHVLEGCVKNNTRLYYKINNLEIENYIKLKHDKMYIHEDHIKQFDNVKIVTTNHPNFSSKYSIDIKDVFYFTDEVKMNANYLFPMGITDYISIHLRLGDSFLETERNYIICKADKRDFSEEKLYQLIEDNYDKNVFFCCDNNSYKLKIKDKYNKIIITIIKFN